MSTKEPIMSTKEPIMSTRILSTIILLLSKIVPYIHLHQYPTFRVQYCNCVSVNTVWMYMYIITYMANTDKCSTNTSSVCDIDDTTIPLECVGGGGGGHPLARCR